MATAARRTYEDFVPPDSLQEETDQLALRVDLSAEGFRKEQIKVQIDNFGLLRISGERPYDGSRWRRFRKEFHVPDTCDAAAIRARLDKQGILLITMPKLSAADAAPGANTADAATAAAGQDHEPAGHAHASAPHARAAAAAAKAEESTEEEDTRAAAMDRSGGQQDEQHPRSDDDAAAPTEPATRSPAAYGFAKDGSRKMLLAIFAVMLALVAAGLFARYTMDPSAETPSSGNHIVSLSDS